ncbi:MAG: hypothetical protein M1837_000903 [Sclerophora amabilis]|nr:MAG: hypothetical protein M1837_000903 [Sclerophora amabilis]
MTSDTLLGGSLGLSGKEAGTPEAGSIAALISDIFEDCLENIIHDEVLSVHREEKIARARSAAIIGEQQAAQQLGSNGATSSNVAMTSPTVGSGGGKITTAGGVYEDGKFTLSGNPLVTTKEVLCPRCRLPRLLHPTTGKGAVAPDPDKKYCARHPPIDKPGHDIWGIPFPSDGVGGAKSKKDKKATKAQVEKAPTTGSFESPNETPPAVSENKSAPASTPSLKCPSCPRYLGVSRIAQHLEKCMGISGRNASRDAMVRMGASGSNSTPYGSRMGTPNPSGKKSPPKRYREDDEDEEEDDETPKKKKKKVVRKSLEKGAGPKSKKGQDDAGKIILGSKDKPDKVGKKRERDDGGDPEVPTPSKKKVKTALDGGSVPPRSSLLKQTKSTNGTNHPNDRSGRSDGKTTTGDEEKRDKAATGEGEEDSIVVSKKKDLGGPSEGNRDSPLNQETILKSKKKQELGTPAQAVGA